MSLTIILDRAGSPAGAQTASLIPQSKRLSPLYIPGQRVSGLARLRLDKDDDVPKVFIKFVGKVKTSITTGGGNTRQTRTYACTMFKFTKILFDGGEFKMRATTYEWPFEFTFPERFDFKHLDLEHNVKGYTSGPQPLPPSCWDIDDGSSTNGSVRYYLSAKVPRSLASWRFKTQLQYTPPRLEAFPHSMHILKKQEEGWHHQKYRFDEVGPRSLSTKESFSDIFHSKSATRNIQFYVTMSAPTVIVIGKAYPVLVTLTVPKVEGCESELEAVPNFTVDSIDIHLNSYTQARAAGILSGDHIGEVENEIQLMATREGLGIKLPIEERIELRKAFPERNYCPPTFSTVAMFRRYRLTVALRIRCLDDTFKVSCKWPNVQLLPSKMEDGVEEAAAMIASGNFAITDDPPPSAEDDDPPAAAPSITEDVPPPTYQEAKTSS